MYGRRDIRLLLSKKQIRAKFREAVFRRDKYTCRGCGKRFSPETAQDNLDAHHITNRNDMPNGGYVKENGISLCKNGESCHQKAEAVLNGDSIDGFSPDELYRKIGSSYELARKSSK